MVNQRVGLQYFSIDTDIELDDKICLIEAKHGHLGFYIIIKLFIKIYGDKGYYYKWTEENCLIFSRRVNIDYVKVNEIILDAVKFRLFNEELFKEYEVLTSKRVQENYLEATKRRRVVELFKPYLLLSEQNVNINRENVCINSKNVDNLKQMKRNEMKVNESKVKDTPAYLLSILLLDKIKANNPNYKQPNLDSWSLHIDKMIRIDKRDPEKIKQVIKWCQADNFWFKNILSTEKLRKQYDRLVMNMQGREKEDWRVK